MQKTNVQKTKRRTLRGSILFLSGFCFWIGGILSGCSQTPKSSEAGEVSSDKEPRMEIFHFQNLGGLGAFSGLHFDRKETAGDEEILYFWTLSDRGPNAEEYEKKGVNYRPFLKPHYTPKIIEFRLFRKSGKLEILSTLELKWKGRNMTGLPIDPRKDETPVTAQGKKLSFDPNGIDSEGIVKTDDGFWICEEYGPSLLKVDFKGNVVKRYSPGSGLPLELGKRKVNRGFEGLAADSGKIYAIMQSPLPEEKEPGFFRLIEFNPKTEKTEREFKYPLEFKNVDKMGDMTSLGGGKFAVIEQNSKTKEKGIHMVRRFRLDRETLEPQTLFDLTKLGWDSVEKMEGLSKVDDKTLAAINDNDFNLTGVETASLVLVTMPEPL